MDTNWFFHECKPLVWLIARAHVNVYRGLVCSLKWLRQESQKPVILEQMKMHFTRTVAKGIFVSSQLNSNIFIHGFNVAPEILDVIDSTGQQHFSLLQGLIYRTVEVPRDTRNSIQVVLTNKDADWIAETITVQLCQISEILPNGRSHGLCILDVPFRYIISHYRDGLLHGHWQLFNHAGKRYLVQEIEYKEGLKDGLWTKRERDFMNRIPHVKDMRHGLAWFTFTSNDTFYMCNVHYKHGSIDTAHRSTCRDIHGQLVMELKPILTVDPIDDLVLVNTDVNITSPTYERIAYYPSGEVHSHTLCDEQGEISSVFQRHNGEVIIRRQRQTDDTMLHCSYNTEIGARNIPDVAAGLTRHFLLKDNLLHGWCWGYRHEICLGAYFWEGRFAGKVILKYEQQSAETQVFINDEGRYKYKESYIEDDDNEEDAELPFSLADLSYFFGRLLPSSMHEEAYVLHDLIFESEIEEQGCWLTSPRCLQHVERDNYGLGDEEPVFPAFKAGWLKQTMPQFTKESDNEYITHLDLLWKLQVQGK
jgi:hypothetical protein